VKINFDFDGTQYECAMSEGVSLAIPMDFAGPQPNFFGTKNANSSPLEFGDSVADTTQGGSCNVDQIQMIPHCNGTHTETIGHIVDQDIFVGHGATDSLSTATVITVKPEPGGAATARGETYRPALNEVDQVLSRSGLVQAFELVARQHGELADGAKTTALIVRTTTDERRKSARYDADNRPAFSFVLESPRGHT